MSTDSFLFYGYKLEIHVEMELGNRNDAKLTLHLIEIHDPFIISSTDNKAAQPRRGDQQTLLRSFSCSNNF